MGEMILAALLAVLTMAAGVGMLLRMQASQSAGARVRVRSRR